jgi:hypothetical protein
VVNLSSVEAEVSKDSEVATSRAPGSNSVGYIVENDDYDVDDGHAHEEHLPPPKPVMIDRCVQTALW